MQNLVNVGCGMVAHPAWQNFDVEPRLSYVKRLDVRLGLPLSDGSADAVYSSHVVEHLSDTEAGAFFTDLWRVLAPGGVIRIVVPDLEHICRIYLQQLDALKGGTEKSDFVYRFALLELFDQSVRDHGGGELLKFYKQARGVEAAYILQRHGPAVAAFLGEFIPQQQLPSAPKPLPKRTLRSMAKQVRWRLLVACCRVLGGSGAEEWLRIGRFRCAGEIHRTMYDEYRLLTVLRAHGFVDLRRVTAEYSSIENFADFALDVVAGAIRKPDSIFFEARKPLKNVADALEAA